MISFKKNSIKFDKGFVSNEELLAFFQSNRSKGLVFVGRSNVGKSSLINSIFGERVAKTSKTPGKTREINLFSFELQLEKDQVSERFYLFDLPGHGYAEISKEMREKWDQLLSGFFSDLPPDKFLILNIQDSRHVGERSDKEFTAFIKGFGLETYLILNKFDKLKTQSMRSDLSKMEKEIYKTCKWVKQIHKVSAESGYNIDTLSMALINFLIKP